MNFWDEAYEGDPPWDSESPPKELIELIEAGIVKPCDATDLGCGRGRIVLYLTSKGFDALGIDISKNAIQQAKELARTAGIRTKFINANVLEYKPEKKVGLVVDRGFYHSLDESQRRSLASEVYPRYLRTKGTLLLWVMSEDEPNWGGPNRISKDELLSFFSNRWEIKEIRKTEFSPLGAKAYFMRAVLMK